MHTLQHVVGTPFIIYFIIREQFRFSGCKVGVTYVPAESAGYDTVSFSSTSTTVKTKATRTSTVPVTPLDVRPGAALPRPAERPARETEGDSSQYRDVTHTYVHHTVPVLHTLQTIDKKNAMLSLSRELSEEFASNIDFFSNTGLRKCVD